ncbi:peptidylprolyl isomerase [Flavobacteriaceae bacterium F08102]|nr:peptidylprolyl isomerase [Flavobacteriaceae bacterium F08102]
MKKNIHYTLLIMGVILLFINVKEAQATATSNQEKNVTLEMRTNKGTMLIELYNETPLHRDNFIKLTKDKFFDGLLFHRVIKNFMAQAGDPKSKMAKKEDPLGEGELPYKIPAEINPKLFHKKGALGAARDNNPERASSGSQFYIVQGKVQNDSLLSVAEGRINNWLASYHATNDPKNNALIKALKRANEDQSKELNDELIERGKRNPNFTPYHIPENQRNWYKTKGGTPHLDQNYTVFGEVVEGLSVIDAITAVPTNAFDRPVNDVRILSVRLVDQP